MFGGIDAIAIVGGRRVHPHPVIPRGVVHVTPGDPDPTPRPAEGGGVHFDSNTAV